MRHRSNQDQQSGSTKPPDEPSKRKPILTYDCTAEQITECVSKIGAQYGYSNRQLYQQLHDALSRSNKEAVYWGLIAAFDSKDYGPQMLAGKLLCGLKPKCRESLVEAILRSQDTWNVSVRELPHYLVKKFSRQQVLDALDEIDSIEANSEHRKITDSYRYWL